jgi:HPt (histidine-containing phosphotransfer) domain-containing protein
MLDVELGAAAMEGGRGRARTALDLDAALRRLEGDRQLLREVIDLFLQDCPRLTKGIREAIDGRDAGELKRGAHKLKGCIGYLGADDAVQLAYRLECMGEAGKLEGAPECFRELLEVVEQVVRGLRETPA